MKKIHILPILGIVLTLGACDYNDKNFDGLDDMVKPTNVLKEKYTLVDADYATISDNNTNKEIAKKAGVDKALESVKTNLFLNGEIPGATYLPAFIAGRYFTADAGSSVKVTYNYRENKSDLLSAYSSVKSFSPDNKNYQEMYGNTAFAPYLTGEAVNKVTDLIVSGNKDPKEGDVVLIDYKYSEAANDVLTNPLLWENFESVQTGTLTTLKDWANEKSWFISSEGGAKWKLNAYNRNQYVQYSAYNTKGVCEAWMITPAIQLGSDYEFSFDLCVGNWNADCLSVWISEDFDGKKVASATWTPITSNFTIPNEPTEGYGDWGTAGVCSLSAYNGKKVYIAFKYLGDGKNKKTTTYQLDNVMIGEKVPTAGALKAENAFGLKIYSGGKWTNPDKKVCLLSVEDYKEMGQNLYYFSEKVPAVNYLPTYLAKNVAYPVEGDTRVIVYRYNNGKDIKVYSDEYVYSAATARWTLNSRVVEKTEQYVYNNGKWNFDPSTVITLKAVKGNAESEAFYRAIVDYVGTKYGTDYYQTGYTNAEFYYGASYYQNNFSFKISSWRTANKAGAAAYKDLSDEALTNLMFERLPEAIQVGLEALYGDAEAVTGVEVTYTVNFSIYDGKDTKAYTIQYLVTGKGVFKYVEDSLKEVSE